MNIEFGTTDDHAKNPYYEFYDGSVQIVIQKNKNGIWHSYIGTKWAISFTSEEQAKEWIESQFTARSGVVKADVVF